MTEIEWTDAERDALVRALDAEDCLCGAEACESLPDFVLRTLAPHVAAREAQAAVRASVLRGHLDALRKVLFEDAATDHHMRLRKAHAVIQQAEQMEPFDNAYASLRTERDDLRARLDQDAATIERLRAEVADLRRAGPWTAHVEKQRAMKQERDGDCICDRNPETTDGPDECCPWHGRAYADWIERGDVLQERLVKVEAALTRVEALADHWRNEEMPDPTTADDDLRAALSPQNHPRNAADAPEAPGQPGRGES